MKPDPLETLTRFYDGLDSIPTPALQVRRTSAVEILSQLGFPVAAAALAYFFLIYCGSTPVRPGIEMNFGPGQQFALRELKSDSQEPTPAQYLFVYTRRRFV